MALSSLLEVVTQACDEMGLQRPGAAGVIGSSLPQDRQMLALLQAAGRELRDSHQWSALIATASITTATASSTYSLPSDFNRLVEDTGWNRTNHFPMLGGISPQRHQFWLSSSVIAPATRKEYFVSVSSTSTGGSTISLHPEPTAAETLVFFYISKNWVWSSGTSTAASQFAADADTTIFKPLLLVKELKWRFRSAKGLASTDLIAERNALYDKYVAADLATPTIDMAGPVGPAPYDWVNIPDGNWSLI